MCRSWYDPHVYNVIWSVLIIDPSFVLGGVKNLNALPQPPATHPPRALTTVALAPSNSMPSKPAPTARTLPKFTSVESALLLQIAPLTFDEISTPAGMISVSPPLA